MPRKPKFSNMRGIQRANLVIITVPSPLTSRKLVHLVRQFALAMRSFLHALATTCTVGNWCMPTLTW